MWKRNIFIFPGHKYLGPGNEVDSGEPIDSDDVIAKAHDKAYDNAKCEEDIILADKIAIFSFIFDWIKNKNWHSAVGALGLCLKHITEKLLRYIFCL
jgi:hypothetical protein